MSARNRMRLAPKVKDEPVEVEEQPKTVTEVNGDVVECATLEDYERIELKNVEKEFTPDDRDEMAKEILSLRNELEYMKEENARLIAQLDEEKKKKTEVQQPTCNDINAVSLKAEVERLRQDNAKLKNENMTLLYKQNEIQSKLDSFKHTYTKSNYNVNMTVRGGGYKTNMNGYQEWC